MPRKIIDVFLSSTAIDLQDHRAAIHAELMATGIFHCTRQEDFGAQNARAVNFCRRKVRETDIFIGLVGVRRGWEPDGHNAQRSITEMEHDWAKKAGRPRYLYVAPENFRVANDIRDSDAQHERQQKFRQRVMAGGERIVSQKEFENPDRFAATVVRTLLTQLLAGDLISLSQHDVTSQTAAPVDEQKPAVAAALGQLAEDDDVDLLALAKNPQGVNIPELEAKLTTRAERHAAAGQKHNKSSAEYWRHIGALAFLHSTQKALAAYEKAVALDPDEAEGQRYLGELQYRLGDLTTAGNTFETLIRLGKRTSDKRSESMGALRIGWIYQDRGELREAERITTHALQLAEAAAWKAGLERAFRNLGIIHQTRGDLDQAEEMQRKALALNEELGNKQGMAAAYANLGNIHQTRGDLDPAEEMQRKAFAAQTKHPPTLHDIADLIGSVSGLPSDLSSRKKMYQTPTYLRRK